MNKNFFQIHLKCPVCDLNFYPESGYYLGAMVVSYLLTAMLTIPVIIIMKFTRRELEAELFIWPLLQFLILGTFLLRYARVFWLHLEVTMTRRLDDSDR